MSHQRTIGSIRGTGLVAVLFAALTSAPAAIAQCPDEPVLQNWTGAGSVTCPCFVANEEAAVILDAPASHYPIEIVKIQVGWGSQFGGAPQSLQDSLNIYAGSLPNPGAPQWSVAGPALNDGFINEFDIDPIAGNKVINSGPFTVSLKFLTTNAGDIFAPSVVHDGNGCQAGKNAVNAIPGGWNDACALGVTGDWVIGVVYRRVNCADCPNDVASAANYGLGFPGTAGVPALTSVSPPIVGGTTDIFIGNSRGVGTPTLMFIGFNILVAPGFWGGTLWVQPATTIIFPVPGAGITLSGDIPSDTGLCGLPLFLQILQSDPGAASGFSSSMGLQLNLGS
jgi:hypothetical protein